MSTKNPTQRITNSILSLTRTGRGIIGKGRRRFVSKQNKRNKIIREYYNASKKKKKEI